METVKVGDNWKIEVGQFIVVTKIEFPKNAKGNVVNLAQYRTYSEPKYKKYTVVLGGDNVIRVVSVQRSTPIKLPNIVKEALLEVIYEVHGKGLYQFLK